METKDRILKGAEELFMRYGIKTMTMDDIAKHLGVSKKTIYLHVKDKNELVSEVILAHMEQERKSFEEIGARAENAIDELISFLRHVKTTMMDMNPSLIVDLKKNYPKAWRHFNEFKSECINNSIQKNLTWGKEEGYYRPEINSEILAISRMVQIESGLNPVVYPSNKFSVLEVQIELLNHFLMGIVTPKGLELFNKYQTKK